MSRRGRKDLHGDWSERLRRQATVRAHVRVYGWVCPGWSRPPHPARDLTADHVIPVHTGGDPRGVLAVLCRSCNGSKGHRHTAAVHMPSVRSRDWL